VAHQCPGALAFSSCPWRYAQQEIDVCSGIVLPFLFQQAVKGRPRLIPTVRRVGTAPATRLTVKSTS
jgi:hypothetical protein